MKQTNWFAIIFWLGVFFLVLGIIGNDEFNTLIKSGYIPH
jgi:hypothetical protein